MLLLVLPLFPRSARAQDECNGGIAAAVAPDGTESTAGANTSGNTLVFTVYNNGPCTDYTYLSVWGDGTVTDATIEGESSFILGPSSSRNVTVHFGIGLPPGGSVHLSASGYIQDEGFYIVTVPYAVSVAPDNEPQVVTGSIPRANTFQVQNLGTIADTYTLTCSSTGSETCGSVSPGSVMLVPGTSTPVTVNFTPGAVGTNGTLTLTAAGGFASDNGSFAITNAPPPPPVVTPDGQAVGVLGNTDAVQTFTVQNVDAVSNFYNLTATCSGTATLCSAPGVLDVPSGASSPVNVSFHVGAAPGTGTVKLTASPSVAASVKDSGWVNVTATPSGTAQVAFVRHASDNIDRGQCLTVGAGDNAGLSCGDLFVVHAMPTYRTLGRDRSLTLYYNSAAATGLYLVAANITEPTTVGLPGKIKVVLTVGASKDSAEYAPPLPGVPMQIVIGRGLAPQPTGVYPMSLLVSNLYGTTPFDTTISGTALIVNRAGSEYGRGWSVLGVEQVLRDPADSTRRIWLAGDGSIRLYRKASPESNVFQGAPGDRPDSLVRFDTLGTKWYRRDLEHTAAVMFDSAGRHRVTRNRVGAVTTFTWGTVAGQARLQSIKVPPNDGVNRFYGLYWQASNARLDSIVDPAGCKLRPSFNADTLVQLSLVTLFPADNPDTTKFVYAGGRMTRRVRESSALAGGFVGTSYDYANNARVTLVKIPSGATGTDTARIAIFPWDEKGLAVAYASQIGVTTTADTGLATRVDGPVNGADDATDFWVDRFGAPTKTLQLGLNARALVWRDSAATLPALVTRVQYANDRIVRMAWNARGNLVETRDSSAHVDGRATKVVSYTYADANTPDSPTRVTDGLGRRTDYVYNSLGLTDSSIDARGLRTKFFYRGSGSLTGVVDSVADRQVLTWWQSDTSEHVQDHVSRFRYDGMGNASAWTSAVGVRTSYKRNLAGMTTDVWDPLGYHRIWIYDGFNRVIAYQQSVTKDTPPPGPGDTIPNRAADPLATCDTTQVVCSDQTLPFPPSFSFQGTLNSNYYYDDDGMNRAVDPRGVTRRFGYDARGHQSREWDSYDTGTTTRRSLYYNVLDQLDSTVSRDSSKVRYRYDGQGRRSAMLLAAVGAVQSDSVNYAYDIMGNLVAGTNRWSSIARTYYADGAVHTQVTMLSGVKDSVAYEYDVTGARTKLVRVHAAGAGPFADSVTYAYGAATGDLDSMLVWWSGLGKRKLAFLWDQLGRRRQITYPPNNMIVTYRYDATGLLRRLTSQNPVQPSGNDRFDFSVRQDQVDPVGRILHQDIFCTGWIPGAEDPLGNACGPSYELRTTNRFDRFGMLAYQQSAPGGGGFVETDSIQYDRSGNLTRKRHNLDVYNYTLDTRPGSAVNNVLYQEILDGSIRTHYSYTRDVARQLETSGGQQTAVYYYDALGRTSGISKAGGSSDPNGCQYDPDGQLARPCRSIALAFDGHAVGAAGDWVFVQGPGLDDPLIGIDRPRNNPVTEYAWVTDGAGRQLAAARSDGGLAAWQANEYRNNGGVYGGGTENSYGFGADRFASVDVPQVSFFRNRVYDQATGRWTQEDPIGIAGGLNLFQYAGNNPVAYTDPFGLCPWCVAGAVILEEAARGAVVGAVTGAVGQIAINKVLGRSAFENVGEATLVGAGIGAVTGGVGSALRIGRALGLAKAATGMEEVSVATRGEAEAAGELHVGNQRVPMVDHTTGELKGVRNPETGARFRPEPGEGHVNLENKSGGNVHVKFPEP